MADAHAMAELITMITEPMPFSSLQLKILFMCAIFFHGRTYGYKLACVAHNILE